MKNRTLAQLIVTILYLAAVAWMLTPQATRRLWAMKFVWSAYHLSSDLARKVGRSEMLREAQGAVPRYELALALSAARDRLGGAYEKLRAS
jgi:hypothetical protein